jgi:hypothetical protein
MSPPPPMRQPEPQTRSPPPLLTVLLSGEGKAERGERPAPLEEQRGKKTIIAVIINKGSDSHSGARKESPIDRPAHRQSDDTRTLSSGASSLPPSAPPPSLSSILLVDTSMKHEAFNLKYDRQEAEAILGSRASAQEPIFEDSGPIGTSSRAGFTRWRGFLSFGLRA